MWPLLCAWCWASSTFSASPEEHCHLASQHSKSRPHDLAGGVWYVLIQCLLSPWAGKRKLAACSAWLSAVSVWREVLSYVANVSELQSWCGALRPSHSVTCSDEWPREVAPGWLVVFCSAVHLSAA
jgi:hypothetical protein